LITLTAVVSVAHAEEDVARTQLAAMRLEASAERLVQYAAQGDATVVRLLLEAGVKPTDADPVRRVTALHNAAAQGHVTLVSLLIERGADVNAVDWNEVTPLIGASFYGRVEAMQLLLAKGAHIDVRPANGPTALLAAVYSGNMKAVDLLLQAGADRELADAFGNTALAVATTTKRTDIASRLRDGMATTMAGS
jgi:ankyrin repeat protein